MNKLKISNEIKTIKKFNPKTLSQLNTPLKTSPSPNPIKTENIAKILTKIPENSGM
jgi:hypothetical protein